VALLAPNITALRALRQSSFSSRELTNNKEQQTKHKNTTNKEVMKHNKHKPRQGVFWRRNKKTQKWGQVDDDGDGWYVVVNAAVAEANQQQQQQTAQRRGCENSDRER
jgi:hypothetical protein